VVGGALEMVDIDCVQVTTTDTYVLKGSPEYKEMEKVTAVGNIIAWFAKKRSMDSLLDNLSDNGVDQNLEKTRSQSKKGDTV
jgi:hypothetical protein